MSGTDVRFAGYSNEELAAEITKLRNGAGAESFYTAVDALKSIATSLADTDKTLREQLSSVGVEWDSDAGRDFEVVGKDQAGYAAGADETMSESASAVDAQGRVFSHARDVLPNAADLHGDTQTNFADDLLGSVGLDTDHAKQVKKTNEARDHTITSLDSYNNETNRNLDGYKSLPVPPNMELSAKPIADADTGTVASGYTGGQNFAPNGSGPNNFGSGNTPFPNGGNGPGHTPGLPGGPTNVPGPGSGGPPGKVVGIGPMPNGSGPVTGPTGPGGLRAPVPFNSEAAATAALAAGGGGAAATVGDQERARGTRSGLTAGPEAEARANASGRNSVRSMSTLPEEQTTAARNAERLAPKGRAGNSMMQPATGSNRGDEDDEHVRKFAVESDDVFADDRLVIDAVLGGEDE